MLVMLYAWTMITGLNASLLGALWPVMYLDFDVALSAVGIFSWIGSIAGLLSNLGANWFLKRFGACRMTAMCACTMALSLLGYTLTGEFWVLCLLCIPFSTANGILAVALNNYVALHYHSRHMSWVHCMWGVGSIIGPNIVSYSLLMGYTWYHSYRVVFVTWAVWTVVLILIRRLWKPEPAETKESGSGSGMSLKELFGIRGVREALLTFFCYNSLEQGMMLWMSSYMVIYKGLSENLAAMYASLFFAGITMGRMISGFMTAKLDDDRLIRLGQCLIAAGILLMLLPLGRMVTLAGLLLIGFGCAPVCPCLLHSTPLHFGKAHTQALVGVQVAASTLGNCILPSLFGLVANHISIALLPVYALVCLCTMAISHHRLVRLTAAKQ